MGKTELLFVYEIVQCALCTVLSCMAYVVSIWTAFCVFGDSYRWTKKKKTYSHSDTMRLYHIFILNPIYLVITRLLCLHWAYNQKSIAIDKILSKTFYNFIEHMTYMCPFVSVHSNGINSKCYVSTAEMHEQLSILKRKRMKNDSDWCQPYFACQTKRKIFNLAKCVCVFLCAVPYLSTPECKHIKKNISICWRSNSLTYSNVIWIFGRRSLILVYHTIYR